VHRDQISPGYERASCKIHCFPGEGRPSGTNDNDIRRLAWVHELDTSEIVLRPFV
jgi:hypothetical protein